VYHYKSTDGITWTRELIGQMVKNGFWYSIDQIPSPVAFTDAEKEGWSENEPDFAKQIVTPLDETSTKRRRDVTVYRSVYIDLLRVVTKLVS
jgi:hypothetical protein